MDRYTLEIVAPVNEDCAEDDQLASALEAIATTHGGIVIVEHSRAQAKRGVRRRFLNIAECQTSIGEELKWLRKRFPHIRFTLKDFMPWADREGWLERQSS